MFKKSILSILTVSALVSLTACSNSGGTSAPESTSVQTQAAASGENTATTPAPANPTGIVLPADGKVYTLEIGSGYAAEAFSSKIIDHLIKTSDEWSGGKLKLKHYPANQLGSDREIFEASQLGNIAMGAMVTAPQSTFIPAVAVFDMGSLSTDLDAAIATLKSGPFRERLNQEYDKVGVKLLTIFPTGYRELETSRPVRSFEDLKGLKIRVMENPYHIEYWTNMGANPTPLPYSELYISLQQKLVDAAENPIDTILRDNTYEQCKSIVLTHHILFNNTITMNKAMWEEMPAEYQQLLQAAMDEAAVWGIENAEKALNEAKETLLASGLEIIEFPQEELDKMKAAAKPCYDKIRGDIGDEIVDLYISELEKNAA